MDYDVQGSHSFERFNEALSMNIEYIIFLVAFIPASMRCAMRQKCYNEDAVATHSCISYTFLCACLRNLMMLNFRLQANNKI